MTRAATSNQALQRTVPVGHAACSPQSPPCRHRARPPLSLSWGSLGDIAMRSLIFCLFLVAASGAPALGGRTKGVINEVFAFRKTTKQTESLLAVYEDGKVNHIYHGFGENPKVQSYSIWRTIPVAEVTIILRRLHDAGIETIKPVTRVNPEYPKLSVGWDWFHRGDQPLVSERPLPKQTQPAITAIVADLFKQLDLDKPTPKDFTPGPPK